MQGYSYFGERKLILIKWLVGLLGFMAYQPL